MPGEPGPAEPDPGVDVQTAKKGQLGTQSRERLMELLQECIAFFPKNVKNVRVKHGTKVTLPFYDEKAKPFVCKTQRFSPHMSDILMKQINQMLDDGILRFSTSEFCARIVPVLKPDGT